MKTGFVAGAFDLLHAGHIYLLKQCKKKCDYLIVGLHVDPSEERKNKNKPVETLLERQIRLESCKYVDKWIIYETEDDLSLIFKYLKPNIRFLGTDYTTNLGDPKPITDKDAVPIEYIESLPIHTEGIRKRIKEA